MESYLKERFVPVETKLWKQRLQYELAGREYARTLIHTSHEEISLLPFYDKNTPCIPLDDGIKTTIMVPLYCTDVQVTIKRIECWLKIGVRFFDLTLHSESSDWLGLFKQMPPNVGGYVRLVLPTKKKMFEISNLLKNTLWNVVYDCASQLMYKGHWHCDEETDWIMFYELLKNDFPSIIVDTVPMQQAGATIIQQLAYGISCAVTHLNKISQKKRIKICFRVAVGNHFFAEIAKLKTLRLLSERICKLYDFPIEVKIIGGLSERHLSLLSGSYNHFYSQLAYQILYFGTTDYLFLNNIAIHQKNRYENEMLTYETVQKIINTQHETIWNGSYVLQNLTYEIGKKALALFQEIETMGGFMVCLKNRLLQRKIKEKSFQEQTEFNFHWKNTNFTSDDFVPKSSWERYPFMKLNRPKTLFEPMITRRLWERIERKIYFQN